MKSFAQYLNEYQNDGAPKTDTPKAPSAVGPTNPAPPSAITLPRPTLVKNAIVASPLEERFAEKKKRVEEH